MEELNRVVRNFQRINYSKSQNGDWLPYCYLLEVFSFWLTFLFPPPSILYHPVSISLSLYSFPSSALSFFSLLGEINYRCSSSSSSNSSNNSRTSEVNDEPPCMEEIDYCADSSSDSEQNFTELDQQIQECAFNKDEEEEKEEGTGRRRRSVP